MRYSNTKKIRFLFVSLITSILLTSCIEQVNIDTENFEDLLVIEAILTTENKKHQVRISRSFSFEDSTAVKESKAIVTLQDNENNIFPFNETTPGVYESVENFSPKTDLTYQLKITTANNNSYTSNFVQPTKSLAIENIYAESMINDNDELGLGIFVDTKNSPDQPVFVKYEFDETFRLQPPFWSPFTAIPSDNELGYEVVLKEEDVKDEICYLTESSRNILLTNTENQSINIIKRFQVRFLNVGDHRLHSRYSINVKQINQSRDTYKFYELLNKLSDPDNIFSQLQPGFIEGNLIPETNPDEKVVGLFSISSVDNKRIFVNFEDFFPNQNTPEYIRSCSIKDITPDQDRLLERLKNAETADEIDELVALIRKDITARIPGLIRNRNLRFFAEVNLTFGEIKIFNPLPTMVPEACGDCRIFGTNVRPDFWED